MNLFRRTITLFSTVILFLVFGFATIQAQNVVEVVENSDEHTVFADMLEEVEMVDLLQEEGPYTVLAPTDEAFEELGNDFEELKENPQRLQNVIIGHLYNGDISSDDVEQAKPVNITDGDIEADNGRVHVVEEVLIE